MASWWWHARPKRTPRWSPRWPQREIERAILAVCIGVMTGGGTVEEPIGRHRSQRTRMAVRADGREAVTHYRVLKRFRGHTYVRAQLETGRTHQIRVHLAHIGYPLVGDPVYGNSRRQIPRGSSEPLVATLGTFKRQALHATRLALEHPLTGKPLEWKPRRPRTWPRSSPPSKPTPSRRQSA